MKLEQLKKLLVEFQHSRGIREAYDVCDFLLTNLEMEQK